MMSNAQDMATWEGLALKHVTSVGMPCSAYASTILHFVKQFSGGPGSPVLKFLDVVSKQYQCSVPLGESFWKAVTNTVFPNKVSQHPLFRAALLLANLTSPKSKQHDGIARLLVDGDIKKLASANAADKVKSADKLLEVAMEIRDSCANSSQHGLSEKELARPLGALFVRVALKAVNKEKDGLEGAKYTDEEIKKAFLKDLSKLAGCQISCTAPGWELSVPPPQDTQEDTPSTQHDPFEAQGDMPTTLAKKGFGLGQVVFEKKQGSGATKLFLVTACADPATLTQVCSYTDHKQVVSVPGEVLLSSWTPFKGDAPVQLAKNNERLLSQVSIEEHKAKCWLALLNADRKHANSVAANSLQIFRKPDVVIVSKSVSAGALTLVPFAPMASFTTNQPTNGVPFGSFEVHGSGPKKLWLAAPSKPSFVPTNPNSIPDGSLLVPYWWVGYTSNKKEANMADDEVVQNGITIPVLVNTVDLAQYTMLLKYKASKPQAEAFKGATVLSSEPAKKKAKKA